MGRCLASRGPYRNLADKEQNALAPSCDDLPGAGRMVAAVPAMLREALAAFGKLLPCPLRGTLQVRWREAQRQWIAPLVLLVSLRLACQRKPDRRASGQLPGNGASALQGPGHESRGGSVVQRPPP